MLLTVGEYSRNKSSTYVTVDHHQVQENDINISFLRDILIRNLSIKAFSERHPIFISNGGTHSDELAIRESIKKQILEITDAKTLQGLDDFLINTARSLNDFHAEVNRATSSLSNN